MLQDIYIIESETEDNTLPLQTVRTLVATDIGHETGMEKAMEC